MTKTEVLRIPTPTYIPDRLLYELEPNEDVLFSIIGGNDHDLPARTKDYTDEELSEDPESLKALAIAKEDAVLIENGTDTRAQGSMSVEMQGQYRNIRIVRARHNITGFRERGWTLIGTPKE